jgi:polar amino acid transport system substrate-binding protein
MRSKTVAALSVAFAFGLVGCASDTTTSESTTEEVVAVEETVTDPCAKENLTLLESGVLTIGTDSPAYPPWFVDDDPSNGKGYESAVAYAVAERLGFAPEEVKWVVAAFNTVITPGDKPFDFDINQVSITDERKNAVDFSSGYYDVNQALVTTAGSKIATAKTLEELKDAKIGAAVGTTSFSIIEDLIQPTAEPAVFDNNDVAKQALANGQIDGLILDLPTAFYVTAVELEDGVILGQFPADSGGEQFGLVLDKGSPLTACVSQAVDSLREDGTLEAIQQEWLADVTNAPFLSRK